MLYAIIGMLVIILDQGVKYWVTSNLMVDSVTQPLIPGVLSLVRLHNDGAAFSFLAGGGARIYFIILTAIFTIAVIIALVTNFINGRFGRWCLVLVTAGGLSNCLDRVLYGYVVDMFKIDLFDFAVFNVADIFITVFAILFIIYIIFGGEDKKVDEDILEDEDDVEYNPLKLNLKKDRKNAESARPERTARERAADAKASKYREDAEDDVASPRFNRSKQSAPAKPAGAPTQARPAAAPAAAAPKAKADNSPAAKRERTLEGFGHQPSSTANAKAAQTARPAKQKKTLYEEDYEQYRAEHPDFAIPTRKTTTAASAPAYNAADPFAEWDRANARASSSRNMNSTARAMGVNPAAKTEAKPAATTQRPAAAPKAEAEKEVKAAPARPAAPAVEKPAAPKAAPAPAPKASETDDYDLDAILNEFK